MYKIHSNMVHMLHQRIPPGVDCVSDLLCTNTSRPEHSSVTDYTGYQQTFYTSLRHAFSCRYPIGHAVFCLESHSL